MTACAAASGMQPGRSSAGARAKFFKISATILVKIAVGEKFKPLLDSFFCEENIAACSKLGKLLV